MSKVTWTPPTQLIEMLRDAEANVADLSPAMEKVSRMGFDEISERYARGGDGDWPPNAPATIAKKQREGITGGVGFGKGGGLAKYLQRAYGPRNAVVKNAAPHAHFFDEGTAAHFIGGRRVGAYSEKKQRRSRAKTRQVLRRGTATTQEPAHPFMYFSDQLIDRAGDVVIAHIFESFGVEAAAA